MSFHITHDRMLSAARKRTLVARSSCCRSESVALRVVLFLGGADSLSAQQPRGTDFRREYQVAKRRILIRGEEP